MEYMEQQMDNLIQSGIDEREWLYCELSTLRSENAALKQEIHDMKVEMHAMGEYE